MADITDVSIPDPKMHEFLTDVEKWVLERIENQPFFAQDVYLDGRHFHNCSFQDCRIFIKVGHFRVTGKLIFEHCDFVLNGPARAVKSVFDLLAHQRK